VTSGALPVASLFIPPTSVHARPSLPLPFKRTPGAYPASCPNRGAYGSVGWPCLPCGDTRYRYGHYLADPNPLLARLVCQNITNDPHPVIAQAYFEFLMDFYLYQSTLPTQVQMEPIRRRNRNKKQTKLHIESIYWTLHINTIRLHPMTTY
jgi:hypothetical protein